MDNYLIKGTQTDGEHEYFIHSMVELECRPSDKEALNILIKDHAFGYDPDDENDPENFMSYGDGLTRIEHTHTRRLTDQNLI